MTNTRRTITKAVPLAAVVLGASFAAAGLAAPDPSDSPTIDHQHAALREAFSDIGFVSMPYAAGSPFPPPSTCDGSDLPACVGAGSAGFGVHGLNVGGVAPPNGLRPLRVDVLDASGFRVPVHACQDLHSSGTCQGSPDQEGCGTVFLPNTRFTRWAPLHVTPRVGMSGCSTGPATSGAIHVTYDRGNAPPGRSSELVDFGVLAAVQVGSAPAHLPQGGGAPTAVSLAGQGIVQWSEPYVNARGREVRDLDFLDFGLSGFNPLVGYVDVSRAETPSRGILTNLRTDREGRSCGDALFYMFLDVQTTLNPRGNNLDALRIGPAAVCFGQVWQFRTSDARPVAIWSLPGVITGWITGTDVGWVGADQPKPEHGIQVTMDGKVGAWPWKSGSCASIGGYDGPTWHYVAHAAWANPHSSSIGGPLAKITSYPLDQFGNSGVAGDGKISKPWTEDLSTGIWSAKVTRPNYNPCDLMTFDDLKAEYDDAHTAWCLLINGACSEWYQFN